MTKYKSIIASGELAFALGTPRTHNPYPYQDVSWWAWDIGWRDARDEQSKAERHHATEARHAR